MIGDDVNSGIYQFPSLDRQEFDKNKIPFKGNFFVGFKEAIAFKESQGKYNKISTLGYLGKYQFGTETLKTVGINNVSNFIKSPKLQERAFIALVSKNKYQLRNEIEEYSGTVVNGIKITESGILAAAHLGGVGSVKKFFKSGGKKYLRDAFGTSLRSYMKAFGGYETAGIVADSNATVN